MNFKGAAAVAALIAVAAVGPVYAGPPAPAVPVAVERGARQDPATLATLHQSLTRAALRACDRLMAEYVPARDDMRRCVKQTLDAAIDAANIAPLSELHATLPPEARYRVAGERDRRLIAIAVLD